MAEYDVVVVGSGPNGIAAAIRLQQQGLSTIILEKADIPGGATRTEEITLEGFKHDMGSAIHPLAHDSPFLKRLNLKDHGLEWVYPEVAFAHPFADGKAYGCYQDISLTAEQLGGDQLPYEKLITPIVKDWDYIAADVLSPISIPSSPLKLIRFGLKAIQPAQYFAKNCFKEINTRTFFYGAAAHSILTLNSLASASFGLVLFALAHKNGWPFPKGGASQINKSMLSYYRSIGGRLELNHEVSDLKKIPSARAYVFDLTPRQLLTIRGTNFSSLYRKRLSHFRYGAGVFKIDWALSDPIPWKNEVCRNAGTVHLGFTPEEIEISEKFIHKNRLSEKPYVLVAQHSVFDDTRAPEGKHTAWAYCHVPNGSTIDATDYIENQIEKAAPGFKECILGKKTYNTTEMETWNPNLVGGDVNGGIQDMTQMFTRPVASFDPYKTSNNQIFICSASTPPGGGVHGMGGYNAANSVIRNHFRDLYKKDPSS